MDEVIIEDESIVGALSFVGAKTTFPKRSLIVGNPAKAIKAVSDDMLAWKTKGTALYQQLPKECHETLIACEPLREEEVNRPTQETLLATWEAIKNK
jgi:carbonic anhydrase/acetyltransferase-like protein (isoleucine patch superfamily)